MMFHAVIDPAGHGPSLLCRAWPGPSWLTGHRLETRLGPGPGWSPVMAWVVPVPVWPPHPAVETATEVDHTWAPPCTRSPDLCQLEMKLPTWLSVLVVVKTRV